jgi:hypothetical protein
LRLVRARARPAVEALTPLFVGRDDLGLGAEDGDATKHIGTMLSKEVRPRGQDDIAEVEA